MFKIATQYSNFIKRLYENVELSCWLRSTACGFRRFIDFVINNKRALSPDPRRFVAAKWCEDKECPPSLGNISNAEHKDSSKLLLYNFNLRARWASKSVRSALRSSSSDLCSKLYDLFFYNLQILSGKISVKWFFIISKYQKHFPFISHILSDVFGRGVFVNFIVPSCARYPIFSTRKFLFKNFKNLI